MAIYPNTQEAAGLWYHDHTTGITAENVYSGLAGTYLIRDAFEKSLRLPSGSYEIPLEIQGRSFRPDGSMYYPPQVATEFYGNTTVVNGKIWPYFNVEPRKYRFRVLNTSALSCYSPDSWPPTRRPARPSTRSARTAGCSKRRLCWAIPPIPLREGWFWLLASARTSSLISRARGQEDPASSQ